MGDRSQDVPARVLCVDDHRDTCEMLKVLFRISGYDTVTAGTFAEALELARRGGFDVAILDNRLPDGSGIDLCRTLRTFDTRTPILFYSAAAYSEDAEAAFSAGANAYVTKPSNPTELVESIARLTQGRRPVVRTTGSGQQSA